MLLLVLGTAVFAQKKLNPKIKANSVINYTLTQNGQDAPLVLTFNSLGNPTKFDWNIDGYGSGTFEMTAKALQSGKGTKTNTREPDVITKLPDYQTFACISKDAYNDMLKNQTFEYDGLKYKVALNDSLGFRLKDRDWDVTRVVAVNGKGEIWILNNPDFPLICKTKDNAQGMDLSLISVQ
ncbi:hypothetical protein Mucpa_5504 [Mucilaginibacter paludis DSM 18603]|uniref:Uncharacterized protein n=2 Tax=Mucilaginibacter TaxID=423349 RepID=H1YAW7_9SPHI|nr:hypothetical protein Mucpa_5504 [Mucilaginibacter paludis DSM 18603]